MLGAPLAVLNVPSIELTVPIYEGTTETVLQKGIGHLEGSSDVLGGSGKHAVLSGHRGLSIAKLLRIYQMLKKGTLSPLKTEIVEDSIKLTSYKKLTHKTYQETLQNILKYQNLEIMSLFLRVPPYTLILIVG